MRQNKYFSSGRNQPEQEDKPPPSRPALLRQRLSRFYNRFRTIFLILAGIIIAFGGMLLYNATQPPPQRLTQGDINKAVERALETVPPKPAISSQVYQTIRPSLVRIHAVVPGSEGENEGSLGTGFVIDDRGTIFTCLHIVRDAVEITVIFADGTESSAAIAIAQPENDLAVIVPQIIPDDLQPAVMSSSATLQVGDEVIAVGNPFGISNSLTAGVVSGLNRTFASPKTDEKLTNLIQFDAAVNPGNSGGPLLNRDGEVVGIVAALLNPTEQDFFIGIGFAISIDTAGGALGSPPY